MKKSLVAAVAAIAITALYAFPASAAVAEMPDGQSLYTLDCSAPDDGNTDNQLYKIDSVTGDMTKIGTGWESDDQICASNVAYDPTTGLYWTLAWNDIDPDTGGYQYGLSTIDLETGEVTLVTSTNLAGDYGWGDNYSIAINSEGDAYIVGVNNVYSVDLSTGDVNVVWQTDIGTNEGGGSPYGAAFNPADGLLYVQYDDTRELWALDVDAESYSLITEFPSGDEWLGPFGFDANGHVWQQNNYDFFTYSLDDPTLLSERVPMTFEDEQVWTESLFVSGVPSTEDSGLAETGVNVQPWLIASAILTSVGLGAIYAVRRRTI